MTDEMSDEELLGMHTFKGVLFTENSDVVGNVITGEQNEAPDESVFDSLEEHEVVASKSGEAQFGERATFGDAKAYEVYPFYFHKMVGIQHHTAFKRAFESKDYDISFDADYEKGTLTVEVKNA